MKISQNSTKAFFILGFIGLILSLGFQNCSGSSSEFSSSADPSKNENCLPPRDCPVKAVGTSLTQGNSSQASSSSSARLKPLQAEASFIFMENINFAGSYQNFDFATQPAQANSVVNSLKALGAQAFLIPSVSDANARMLGATIQSHGGFFYTQERWSFSASVENGVFSCATYKATRFPLLKELRTKFPQSFRGLHLLDEPVFDDLPRLGAMVRCVRADNELKDLEMYLNLLPLMTNSQGFYSKTDIRYMTPAEVGFECVSGTLIHPTWYNAQRDLYLGYVQTAMREIVPNYLAFDFYPYIQSWNVNCPMATQRVVADNHRIIEFYSRASGVTEPISYLQNFCHKNSIGFLCALEDQLQWASAMAIASGVTRFAYFASHEFTDAGQSYHGLLNLQNLGTGLYTQAYNWNLATKGIRSILAKSTYQAFISPKTGIPSAGIVATIDALNLSGTGSSYSSGEYLGPKGERYLLITANELVKPGQWTQVFFNRWFSTVELYRPSSDSWQDIRPNATATNYFNLWFNGEQHALIRLN